MNGAILRHKVAAAGAAATVTVLVAVMAATALSSSNAGPLSDSTSCSQWSSASRAMQSAYSRLYLTEHGAPASAAHGRGGVQAAINAGCTHAAYLGEGDEVTVLAAVRREF